MDENDILDAVYALYEGDDDGWETTDDEYLAARRYANAAISFWEHHKSIRWNDLWTKLEDAADGDKTTTNGTDDYSCPTNMRFASSWVRTYSSGIHTLWTVIRPENSGQYANSQDKVCWFTGNIKDGFSLSFNPNVDLTTGDVIHYEYYKKATTFDDAADVTEMNDPYFIVYYILWRMLAVDGEDNQNEEQEFKQRLDNMESTNYAGYFDVSDTITETINVLDGFGV